MPSTDIFGVSGDGVAGDNGVVPADHVVGDDVSSVFRIRVGPASTKWLKVHTNCSFPA